jgi:hypothetical protein
LLVDKPGCTYNARAVAYEGRANGRNYLRAKERIVLLAVDPNPNLPVWPSFVFAWPEDA